jgi:hypothetical protein
MHSYSVIIVNEHIESLLAEAAERRLAKLAPKRSLRERLASVAASIKSLLSAPADAISGLPSLSGYPYES